VWQERAASIAAVPARFTLDPDQTDARARPNNAVMVHVVERIEPKLRAHMIERSLKAR
jgi:hypothetical protein